MTAGSLRLKPGMSPHAPHQHPEEEFMVITEGAGEIVVDGKTTRVSSGSMMYCAAGTLHGIVNTGKDPLLFYFYKWKVYAPLLVLIEKIAPAILLPFLAFHQRHVPV